MAHLSHCEGNVESQLLLLVWSCVSKPIRLMGSGPCCNAVIELRVIEAATVACLSEASSTYVEKMSAEMLWQAHAEQLHTLSLGDQAAVQPRRPPLETWPDLATKKDSPVVAG